MRVTTLFANKQCWLDTQPMKVKVQENGRMILPVRYRASLGLERGGYVVVEEDDDGLRVTSPAGALERARALFRRYVPHDPDRPLASEELIAERRAEAAPEDEEAEAALAARAGDAAAVGVETRDADGRGEDGEGGTGRRG